MENQPVDLIGRESDLGSVRAYFGNAGVRGGALLLAGDAGIGKSALLDEFAAVEAERGVRVLRAAGAQFESEINYSTLNQLLFPLGDEMASLSADHRTALRCALGFEVGPVPDRLVMANAALLWLRAAAADAPILIILDDLQWVDRASAEVLSLIARRLVGSPIELLAACRSGEHGFFHRTGPTEVALSPLPASASRALVDLHFRSWHPPYVSVFSPRRPATRSRCWSCLLPSTGPSERTSPPCLRSCPCRNACRSCSTPGCETCRSEAA